MMISDDKPGRYGWMENPMEVERIVSTLPKPLFGAEINDKWLDEAKEVLLYPFFRKLTGGDAPKGPQGIGDCVSWGYANFANYYQVTAIIDKLVENKLDAKFMQSIDGDYIDKDVVDFIRSDPTAQYEEIATESIYGFSRVEVGQQHGSYQDGSVGAWAAKAMTLYGVLTRKKVGAYDPQRAKSWGAKGVPDDMEPEAKESLFKVMSKVRTFKEAAAAIQNLQGVPICSNQGFSMTRDSQGFCKPQGTWYHCMLLMGVRWDRPGCLCSQSWGKNTPNGPVYKDQPDNTFWIDANVVDRILSQDDSFTGNGMPLYKKRNITDWRF